MNQDEMKAHAADLAFQIIDSIERHPGQSAQHRDNLTDTLVEVYQDGVKEGEAENPPPAPLATQDQIEKTKHILMSKTFWGAIVSAAAYFGPHFGLHLGTAEQTEYVSNIVAVVGTMLTVYGRFNAKQGLNFLGGK